MPTNVTEDDKRLEALVMGKASELFGVFHGVDWTHNLEDTAVFDFDGFYLGTHRYRADVKVIYCDKDKYDSNIMSMEKYEDFAENGHLYEYYLLYYYPSNSIIRIYDLHRAEFSIRDIKIFHKRENVYKDCRVAFIRSADKIQLQGITINETDRENRQIKYSFKQETQTTVFDEEYIEM